MENLFLKKEQSITFTGHRSIPYGKLSILKIALKNIILELYAKGYNNYYCGMAMGFDLLSAEVVLSLKAEHKELRLIAVVPYRNQDERFSFADKKRYQSILSRADETILLCENYHQGCLLIQRRALKSVCKSNSKSGADTDIVFVYLQDTD